MLRRWGNGTTCGRDRSPATESRPLASNLRSVAIRRNRRPVRTDYRSGGSSCSDSARPPEFEAFEAINREVFDEFAPGGQLRLQCDTRIRFGMPSPV